MRRWSLLAFVLILVSCESSGSKWWFPLDEEGYVPTFSRSDICYIHKRLAEFSPEKKTPSDMVGDVIIDGTVLNITSEPHKIHKIHLQVIHVLLNSGYKVGETFDVLTPLRARGNIDFAVGNTYRISAQPIAHTKFYTWGPEVLQLRPAETICREYGYSK